MWDEAKLVGIARECAAAIIRHARPDGVMLWELRLRSYRALDEAEKGRIGVLLLREPELSAVVCPRDTLRFWPRGLAPPGAFNIRRQQQGEAITPAARYA